MHVTKIKPIELTPKTAYLTGAIIGDGHISNSFKSQNDKSRDYRIVIDVTDEHYSSVIFKLINSVISTVSTPKSPKIRGNRKKSFYLQVRNKSLFYFLTDSMQIPAGAKSHIVHVPDRIKRSSGEIKKYFLAGLFDTDGGLRQNSIGFCTASKRLNQEVSVLLKEFSITHILEEWKNREYDRMYYGILIKKSEIDTFLKIFPLQNNEKSIRISNKFNAGMPEWPNGTVYSD